MSSFQGWAQYTRMRRPMQPCGRSEWVLAWGRCNPGVPAVTPVWADEGSLHIPVLMWISRRDRSWVCMRACAWDVCLTATIQKAIAGWRSTAAQHLAIICSRTHRDHPIRTQHACHTQAVLYADCKTTSTTHATCTSHTGCPIRMQHAHRRPTHLYAQVLA